MEKEIWDVYDANWKRTGRTIERGQEMPLGDFHLVVHIWFHNKKGEFLIAKRTPNKTHPNMWETTGGSVLSGEDSLTAALRETKEELGLTLNPKNAQLMLSLHNYRNHLTDVWLFEEEIDLKDIIFQPEETCDAKWATVEEIETLVANKKMIAYEYTCQLFQMIREKNKEH